MLLGSGQEGLQKAFVPLVPFAHLLCPSAGVLCVLPLRRILTTFLGARWLFIPAFLFPSCELLPEEKRYVEGGGEPGAAIRSQVSGMSVGMGVFDGAAKVSYSTRLWDLSPNSDPGLRRTSGRKLSSLAASAVGPSTGRGGRCEEKTAVMYVAAGPEACLTRCGGMAK